MKPHNHYDTSPCRFTPTPVHQTAVVQEEITVQTRDSEEATREEIENGNGHLHSSNSSANDNDAAISNNTVSSISEHRDHSFGLDLALSVALYSDKEHCFNDQDDPNIVESSNQNGERYREAFLRCV